MAPRLRPTAVLDERDTLVIQLQDVNAASWWAGILATSASPSGNACSRFVGHATSTDPQWPM
ncbi:hypothetical protein [Streptomyces sp. NPDC002845]